MYSVITTAMNYGLDAIPVHVEADVSEGLPCFDMVGFLSNEVKEARDRVRTALKNAGYPLPAKHITVNLTPASLKKSGSSMDFPVAGGAAVCLRDCGRGAFEGLCPVRGGQPEWQAPPGRRRAVSGSHGKKRGVFGGHRSEGKRAGSGDPVGHPVIPVADLKEFVSLCRQELTATVFTERRIRCGRRPTP